MSENQSFLGAAVRGALAGTAGTFVLSAAMEQIPNLLKQAGMPLPRRGEASGVGGGKHSEQTVENLASKAAEVVLDKHLTRKQTKAGGQLVHWLYGAAWGSFYGATQSKFKLPHLLHGAILAALMGITASTVIPSTHAAPWPKDLPPQRTILQMTYILLFAQTTALVYALLTRRK